MKPSIASKLDQLSMRMAEVGRLLNTENITADMDHYRRLTREHGALL
ncbi:MAG: peptide chain release factor 1, partial [Burkholderiales bacterium]|nr:peptide chain release factor 1 [Burkholderiales bacterium]